MMSTPRKMGILAAVILGFAILAAQHAWHIGAELPDTRGDRSTPAPATGADRGRGPAPLVADRQPVEEFTVVDIDGRPISSADWRNTVTIVTFWATWCLPCLDEIPEFIGLQKKYHDELQIIGFSMDDGPADRVMRFAHEHKINYRVAIVEPDLGTKFGGVLGLPTSFVLDREGRVAHKHIGLVSPAVYEQDVRALAGLSGAAMAAFDDGGQVPPTDAARASAFAGPD
jgi:cytochrome c biogenesis protein CcmG/thiol:disulfide interchange protein DsbE